MTQKPKKTKRTKRKVQAIRTAPDKAALDKAAVDKAIRDTYIQHGGEPAGVSDEDGGRPSQPIGERQQLIAVIVVGLFVIISFAYFIWRSR